MLQTKNRILPENPKPRRNTYDKQGHANLPNTPTIKVEASQKVGRAARENLRQKRAHVEKENTPPAALRLNQEAAQPGSPARLRRTTTYTKVTSPCKDRVLKVPASPTIHEEEEKLAEKPASPEFEQDSLMMSPEPLQLEDLGTSQNYHVSTSVDGEVVETEVSLVLFDKSLNVSLV